MKISRLLTLILTIFQQTEFCVAEDTLSARWVLFYDISMSWNDASRFCRKLAGPSYLPYTPTWLTMDGLETVVNSWAQQGLHLRDLWLGIYTPQPNQAPATWEKDCSVQPDNLTRWDAGPGTMEPDFLDRQLCVRAHVESGRLAWRTKGCDAALPVVCHFPFGMEKGNSPELCPTENLEHMRQIRALFRGLMNNGNCTFDTYPSRSVRDTANLFLSEVTIPDIDTCTAHCLATRFNKTECVAVEFKANTSHCSLYYGHRLLSRDDVTTGSNAETRLRKCFSGWLSTSPEKSYWYNWDPSTSATPSPACGCDVASTPAQFLPYCDHLATQSPLPLTSATDLLTDTTSVAMTTEADSLNTLIATDLTTTDNAVVSTGEDVRAPQQTAGPTSDTTDSLIATDLTTTDNAVGSTGQDAQAPQQTTGPTSGQDSSDSLLATDLTTTDSAVVSTGQDARAPLQTTGPTSDTSDTQPATDLTNDNAVVSTGQDVQTQQQTTGPTSGQDSSDSLLATDLTTTDNAVVSIAQDNQAPPQTTAPISDTTQSASGPTSSDSAVVTTELTTDAPQTTQQAHGVAETGTTSVKHEHETNGGASTTLTTPYMTLNSTDSSLSNGTTPSSEASTNESTPASLTTDVSTNDTIPESITNADTNEGVEMAGESTMTTDGSTTSPAAYIEESSAPAESTSHIATLSEGANETAPNNESSSANQTTHYIGTIATGSPIGGVTQTSHGLIQETASISTLPDHTENRTTEESTSSFPSIDTTQNSKSSNTGPVKQASGSGSSTKGGFLYQGNGQQETTKNGLGVVVPGQEATTAHAKASTLSQTSATHLVTTTPTTAASSEHADTFPPLTTTEPTDTTERLSHSTTPGTARETSHTVTTPVPMTSWEHTVHVSPSSSTVPLSTSSTPTRQEHVHASASEAASTGFGPDVGPTMDITSAAFPSDGEISWMANVSSAATKPSTVTFTGQIKPRLCPCHKEICRKRAAPSQFQPDLLQVIPRNSTGKYHRRQCTAWSEGTLVTVGITAISVSACCLLVAAVVVADVRVMVRDFRARRAKGAVDTAGSTRRNQRKVC